MKWTVIPLFHADKKLVTAKRRKGVEALIAGKIKESSIDQNQSASGCG
jgi:hypothetical protein